MKSTPTRFLAAFLIACAGIARAAPLDLAPDAVLGKPDYTTPTVGAASATNIQMPMGIAEDPVSGELWVTDHFASRVLRYASARAFANGEAANLVLGQANFTASEANRGGAVAANTLNRPRGIAVDQARRLYVSDSDNHRVLVYAPPFANGMDAGVVVGQSSFTTNAPDLGGGTPTHIGLRAPHGLALDDEGQLWVADAGNARVLRYGAPLRSFASAIDVKGQPGFFSRTPVLDASGMGFPVGMNVDREGTLWVVDRGFHRVTRHHRNVLRTDGAPADWVICQPDFTTATAGVTATNCNFPEAVVVDPEQTYAYIADAGNNRVLRVFSKTADAWIGQAGPNDQLCNRNAQAPSAATLCNPFALAFDRLGNLLVADGANGRVLRYDQPSERNTPVPLEASPSVIPQDGGDLAVTIHGLRFHGDTTAVLNGQPVPTRYLARNRLGANLPAAALAGSGALNIGLQTPGATLGSVQPPIPLARYARTPGDRLADRVLGQPDFEMDSSSNSSVGEALVGSVNAANLEGAGQVVIDPVSGRVFLSQAHARRVLSWPSHADLRNGQSADVVIGRHDVFEAQDADVSARTLGQAFNGLAVDRAGRLYVADYFRHRVLRFDPPFATGMPAARVFGQGGSFTSDTKNLGGRSGASLAYPGAVAVDANRLFVFDSDSRRILVYENPDADTTADAAIGQADLVSAVQMPASATRIGGAGTGLALDGSGRLYFADYDANRVLRFSPPYSSGMAADLVIGQPDFTTRGPGTSERSLDRPGGLAIDAAGHLFVVDRSTNRIIRFAAPLASGQAAHGLLGQAGYLNASDGTGRDGLNNPESVAVDESGNVLVYDQSNSRLLAYDRPFGRLSPSRTVNLSTRMAVLTGENVLIGGFVIEGATP
ncbi:MAG: NHL repeat-containing protein, partial [Acidobacteria bacterium]|nr:NHL repeat-containing protein [Acidobacteriota bacterium]